MNHRERILAALAFEPPDELPCHESFWDDTIATWRSQGFPADQRAEDYFELDLAMMSLDLSPRYPQRLLRREEGYIVYEDRYGYTARKLDGHSGTIEFLAHCVSDRLSWEQTRARMVLRPDDVPRLDVASFFAHFDPYPCWNTLQQLYRDVRQSNRYLLFNCYGPKEASWRMRGMEQQILDLSDEPELVREMAETYTNLTMDVLSDLLQRGLRPDGLFLVEDLGWNRSLLLSPQQWRQLYKPSMQRLGQFLHDRNMTFWMHSDGAIHLLLDDLIDCGVQVMQPLEVTAGMNAIDLRRKFGKRLCLFGNISAKAMLESDAAFGRELEQKVPLARRGGYICHSDHSVPPGVPFDRYHRMMRWARTYYHACGDIETR